MEPFDLLLLRLLRLKAVDSPLIEAFPAEEILIDMFADQLTKEQLQEFCLLLRQSAQEKELALRLQNTEILAYKLESAALSQSAIIQAHEWLDQFITLESVIGASVFEQVEWSMAKADMFRYVQQFHIVSPAGTPEVIIVGGGRKQTATTEVTVSLGEKSLLERKTEITYSNSLYPRLTIDLNTRFRLPGRLDSERDCRNWIQHASAASDINVYSNMERLLGRISTRHLDLPFTCEGAKFKLSILPETRAEIIATKVEDNKGNLLAQVVRVVPPNELAASSSL